MQFQYKKPGALLWATHTTKTLDRDVILGVLQPDWCYRILTQIPGQFRECTLDELLNLDSEQLAQAEYDRALAVYQKEPLPALPELPPATSPLGVLLYRYLSRCVGVNYRNTKLFERALLTRVSDDFFRVLAKENKTSISFPWRHVLKVIEVFHVVVYSGAVGVSISIPLG